MPLSVLFCFTLILNSVNMWGGGGGEKEHFSARNLTNLFHFDLILVKQLMVCWGKRI